MYSYVSEFYTKEKAPRVTSFTSMCMPMATAFLAVLGYFLIPIDFEFYVFYVKMSSWRIFILVSSVIHFINFIVFIYLPETPKFLESINHSDEALNVLRNMYAVNTGAAKEVRCLQIDFPILKS